MRHGRAAALLAAERLLHLADFRALQVADFLRDSFERSRDDRQRRKILRVAVAFDHLRGDRRGRQPQPLADFLLDFRARDACRCPPRLKFFPRAICLAPLFEIARRSRRFSAYQFATFSPNVIGSACMPCVRPISRRVFEFPRALLEHFAEPLDALFRSAATLRAPAALAPCPPRHWT